MLHTREVLITLLLLGVTACQATAIRKITPTFQMGPITSGESLTAAAPEAPAASLPTIAIDEIGVHFLPVGSGMCQMVQCPSDPSAAMVVDCGATPGSQGPRDLTRQQTIQAVQQALNGKQVTVVMSHSDADHSNYVPDIFANPEQIRSVWMGGNFAKYPAAVQNWAREMHQSGVLIYQGFAAGFHNDGRSVQELSCGTASSFILTVNSAQGANDASLMLALKYGETKWIFPGDATGVAQETARSNYPEGALVSTVVAASHHGANSNGSNSPSWAQAVLPNILVSSAGLRHYHPRCDAMDRYASRRLLPSPNHLYRCGRSGAWDPYVDLGLSVYNTEDVGVVSVVSGTDPRSLIVYCNGQVCSYAFEAYDQPQTDRP